MLRRLIAAPDVPPLYKKTFWHLYLDIAWYGILAGSAINFQAVYAARLGATGFQIGLLGAAPALISLLVSFPAGSWLEKRPISKTIFYTSVYYRIGYLFWIFLPLFLDESGQVWGLIGLVLAQAIPLTVLGVGFNALFAAAVPPEWRAHVAGVRNVVVSISVLLSSLLCGYLLKRIAFPLGYQIVFGIGFIGAAMSSFHLYFIHPVPKSASSDDISPQQAPLQPPMTQPRPRWLSSMRLDILHSPFRWPLLVMLGFHLAQFLSIPIFPLYFVNHLHLNDEQIGIGTAIFHLSVFLGSTRLASMSDRLGYRKVTGIGALVMSFYPILLSLASTPPHYYLLSAVGGFGWAMMGGAYANYLLEKIPPDDRPAHLAWYNVILNVAILIGSLVGPWLAGFTGLVVALLIFGFFRLLSGIAILKWG